MNYIESFKWRYAAKKMNGQVVPSEKLNSILEAARLAPTSSGLQPFEIFVVTNPEIKEKIKAVSWNQSVVTECSHLLVFAAWDTYTVERINEMFDLVNNVRGFKNDGWEKYREFLLSTYPGRDPEINFQHASKQAYISFGFAMAAAAMEKVDSTPLEGFDPAAVDEILGLRAKGLRSSVLLTLGYREVEGDWLVKLEKVRNPKEKFITEIK
jgi:nitroreductase/dihydropteridine reductase